MKRRVQPGEVVLLSLPWSEVCMHLKLQGKVRRVRVLDHGAQILNPDGTNHSFPILHGEAGIYRDRHGLYVEER